MLTSHRFRNAFQTDGGIAGAVESMASSAASSVVGEASSVASSAVSSASAALETTVTGNNVTINGTGKAGADNATNGTNSTNGTNAALSFNNHITSGKEILGFGLMAAGVYAGLSML